MSQANLRALILTSACCHLCKYSRAPPWLTISQSLNAMQACHRRRLNVAGQSAGAYTHVCLLPFVQVLAGATLVNN